MTIELPGDFKLPDDAQPDFSEWEWDSIIGEVKSLVADVEEAVLGTLQNCGIAGQLGWENGKLSVQMGLPFVLAGEWIWCEADLEALMLDDFADPHYMEPSDRKAVAALLRRWADTLEAVQDVRAGAAT